MGAKLALLILITTATSASLLSIRQQRVQAAHELAEALDRAMEAERNVWRLRAEIAKRVTPERLHTMLADAGPLEPILVDWCPPPMPPLFAMHSDGIVDPRPATP